MNAPLEIDCLTLQAKREAGEEFVLLDCREREEFDVVHLPDARLVPMSEIQDRAEELEPLRAQEIIVYCHHGQRSLHVARWLRQRGFARAQSLSGGIDLWATEVDPSLARY